MVQVVEQFKDVESKRNAGYRAADMIEDQMVIGLGTGSTIHFMLERLSARIKGGLNVKCIPTSFQTEMKARMFGINLSSLYDYTEVDIAIDGADQIDKNGYMIKGRGAAHLREKCVANAAKKLIVVVDSKKMSNTLNIPVPIEVLQFACPLVARYIGDMAGVPHLRRDGKKDGPIITDNGNVILDCNFGVIKNPPDLEEQLNQIPGALCNGIFSTFAKKTTVIVGDPNGTRDILF